jgi:hypothetical protein
MLPRAGGEVMGHSFQVESHYSARQMNHPGCRHVDPGGRGVSPRQGRHEPPQNARSAADVCEGWQVMVHSPLDDAETFDVVDTADGRSFMAELSSAGGGLFNPHRGRQGERKPLLDTGGLPLPVLTRGLVSAAGLGVVVNGRFWEQFVLPTAALAAHPAPFEVRIEDNQPGRASTLLEHRDGPLPLAPYVAFVPSHRRIDTDLLREVPTPAAPAPPTAPEKPAPPDKAAPPALPPIGQ